MIMKKISKLNNHSSIIFKLIVFFGLGFFLMSLTACFKNQVTPNEGQIRLFLADEFTSHMTYEEIPDFVLSFAGTINTIANVPNPNATVFASNDDVIFSSIVKNLIDEYCVYTEVIATNQTEKARINTLDENNNTVVNYFVVDNGLSYDEVAYLDFPNGLKMTINYRRFISAGITYYCWRLSSSISFYLYYPLMVVEEDSQKRLLILTLPSRIQFQVGSQLKASNILAKKEYLQDAKYTFTYFEDENIVDKEAYVRDYYQQFHDGYEEDGHFYFVYLNIKYEIIFLKLGFTIRYISSLS